ncbi:MAG: hypothetical protein K9J16_10965 [Melioribacteraceae bacterium]|nr:hypothetical protein [Melioribacteraceae bacterium]MCF8356558.1 hypothetical protein [Melioribacteraceae bacterium]MCF8394217.1 hypothetical protein [Melioribacteraceae bacterium]MCF8419937.1 hypothetical protein [Melioribacteraceae bacterium]
MKRYLAILITLAVSFLLIQSCKEKGTEPQPEPKPPGYQEDIPWPSLADSPWPMYRADPQSTGRSRIPIPFINTAKSLNDSLYISTGIVIGEDSTLYAGILYNIENSDPSSGLAAIDHETGKIKWLYEFLAVAGFEPSTPIVGRDNIIYISNPSDKSFIAVNPDGSLRWSCYVGAKILQTGIVIDKEGNFYMVGIDEETWNLYGVSNTGELILSESGFGICGDFLNGMSISPDSKTLYIPGCLDGETIIAYDLISNSVKWSFGEGRLIYSAIPVISSQGDVYIISKDGEKGAVYCLKSDGTIKWKYLLKEYYFMPGYQLFSLDKSGNLIVGLSQLYSINYEGILNWVDSSFSANEYIVSPIITDANNNILLCHGISENIKVTLLNQNDQAISSVDLNNSSGNYLFSFSVGYNSIYIPTYLMKQVLKVN